MISYALRRLFRNETRSKTMRLTVVVMYLCCVTLISSQFKASAQLLLDSPAHPWKQGTYASSFGRSMSYPVLANGYLLSYRYPQTASSKPAAPITFKLTSLQTGASQQLSLSLPSKNYVIEDAEAEPGGGLEAAGVYLAEGASQPTPYLASISPGGGGGYLITLGTFHPDRVCVAPDRTTWVFGHDPVKESDLPSANYDMMLSFSPSGVQTGHYLPRSTFSTDVPITLRKGQAGVTALLDCNAEQAGVYVSVHGQATWTEVSAATKKATTVPVPITERSRLTGLAFVAPGSVYASMIAGGTQHLYKLAPLSISSSKWEQVSTQSNFARLLGKDSNSLVYFNSDTDHASPQLLWSRP